MGVDRRSVLWGTVAVATLAGCTSDESDDAADGGDADGMAGDDGGEPSTDDGTSETGDLNDTDANETDDLNDIDANDTGNQDDTGTNETDGGAVTDAASATVQTVEHEEFGSILVDAEGLTLYQFDDDQQGAEQSACTEDCAEAWPPLTAETEPTAGEDVTVELTTFEREDGERQVAADGWPLYYYAGDEEPGDAAGQGVDGLWWVLRPDGTANRSETGEEAEQPG